MNYPKYQLYDSNNSTVFEFRSVGRNGAIDKLIHFTATDNKSVYNLGFGDKVRITEEEFGIDDSVISDNGDRNKILSTIADAIYIFTELHPEVYVHFTGSSQSRIRLYRIAISNNLRELSIDFNIFGLANRLGSTRQEAIPFNSETDFEGFLIIRK